IEEQDRRVALFNTPNVLQQEAWVNEAGGLGIVHERIHAEINDFCYYLATEVDLCTVEEYMTPPATADKQDLIASKMPAGQKIAFFLQNGMFKQFEELAHDYEQLQALQGFHEGRIYED